MHLVLHTLKFACECAAILIWVLALAFVVLGNLPGDNVDGEAIAQAMGTLGGIALFLIGLFFFALWFLLVHFAHLPWWN